MFKADYIKVVGDNGRAYIMLNNLFKSKNLKNKKFENLTSIKNIEAAKKPIFLTPGIKKMLTIYSKHLSNL